MDLPKSRDGGKVSSFFKRVERAKKMNGEHGRSVDRAKAKYAQHDIDMRVLAYSMVVGSINTVKTNIQDYVSQFGSENEAMRYLNGRVLFLLWGHNEPTRVSAIFTFHADHIPTVFGQGHDEYKTHTVERIYHQYAKDLLRVRYKSLKKSANGDVHANACASGNEEGFKYRLVAFKHHVLVFFYESGEGTMRALRNCAEAIKEW